MSDIDDKKESAKSEVMKILKRPSQVRHNILDEVEKHK